MAIYMKVQGITGDVSEKSHEKWIELDSFDLGVKRNVSTRVGRVADRDHGVPDFSEVSIIKRLDMASNNLFQAVCSGDSIGTVEVHICSTGKEFEPYVKYLLENVIVSRHHNYVASGAVPTESLTLNYTKIQKTYIGRDSQHQMQSPHSAGYDLETTRKI